MINKQQNDTVNSRSKPLSDENEPDSDHRTGFEDLPKTHAVLSNIKTDMQVKEVAIDIKTEARKDAVEHVKDNADYSVYGYYGQHMRPPKTAWVMFQSGASPYDYNEPLDYDPSSRNGFIRLTFSILLIMILITTVFVITVLSVDDLRDVFSSNKGMMLAISAMVVMVGISYSLVCVPCTRTFPCNIIILVIAVICMSIICAWITSRYDTVLVCYALMATCVVVFVCVLLACSSFDFTAWMLYVIVIAAAFGAITMIVLIGMMITGTYMKTLHLILLIGGTLINVVVLTIELQMILGGKAIELGEDEYALGALLLYTSIVDIFLKLVQIFGILDSM